MSFRFKAGACQVELGFSCFILAAFACLFMGGQGPWALFCMALHEAGHLLAMKPLGAAPRQVQLSALGLRMVLPPGAALWGAPGAAVSLAGPGANLACCLLCLLLGCPHSAFARCSLALALVHLLPIEPLDGGLALRHILETRLPQSRAKSVSRWVSGLLLLPLAVLGFLVLLRTRYNYSLLALSMYLMLYLLLREDYAA